MAILGFSALETESFSDGTGALLTFILPGGCNLSCPFCAISSRQERQDHQTLEIDQYTSFVRDAARCGIAKGVVIVGDEPLLPQSWPLAHEIVKAGEQAGIPRALVTNGTWLSLRATALASHAYKGLTSVTVSIDAIGAAHDKARRAIGAFEQISQGLRAAARFERLREKLIVASVIRPKRIDELRSLPSFLYAHGIRRWWLSPQLKFCVNGDICIHPRLLRDLPSEIPPLLSLCADLGIDARVDDELGLLTKLDWSLRGSSKVMRSPEVPIIRMKPDGSCSVFSFSYGKAVEHYSHWDGIEEPALFLKRALDTKATQRSITSHRQSEKQVIQPWA